MPAADNWSPQNLLLAWPTGAAGLYSLEVDIGDGSKAVIGTSAPVQMQIDNSYPAAQFTSLAWRVVGDPMWTPLELICPVVTRPVALGNPLPIEFRVGYSVSAAHLRNIRLSGGGCGGSLGLDMLPAPNWTDPADLAVPAVNPYDHWHRDPDLDNSVARQAVFRLASGALEGAYSFNLFAASRALNPSDADGFIADWEFNPAWWHVYHNLPVAIVNA